MEVDSSLRSYIESSILPLYSQVDNGHNAENHIIPVINQSLDLASRLDMNLNLNIVYTAAAYHDIGLLKGRELHHIFSKEFVLNDKHLQEWFTDEEIKIIAEAAEDHRASLGRPPRTIYGMIVADSDKSVDLSEILLRTHQGMKSKYPDEDLSTFDKEFDLAYQWLVAKNSTGGYLHFYVDQDKINQLSNIQKSMKDKKLIREEYYKAYINSN